MITEEELRARATVRLESMSKKSKLFNNLLEKDIAKFHPVECIQGAVLGRGGFSTVFEVKDIELLPQLNTRSRRRDSTSNVLPINLNASLPSDSIKATIKKASTTASNSKSRRFIANTILRKGLARYAIKQLSNKTLSRAKSERKNDKDMFVAGVIDLAMEFKFLSVLHHPHIIKMRGISSAHPCSDSYFLVLDRLHATLGERIGEWKRDQRKLDGFSSLVDFNKQKKRNDLLNLRLCVAYNISSAMDYLHTKRIVYRDLKPDNIGFDVRGEVKVFDFGLAREIEPVEGTDENKLMSDKLFVMSGDTGSLRYMAPENALHQPYNHKVDVYSFGLIFWQMLKLETPFSCINSVSDFRTHVIEGGLRPKFDNKLQHWPPSIKKAILRSWSTNIKDRPEFCDLMDLIRKKIADSDKSLINALDITNRTQESILQIAASGYKDRPRRRHSLG